MSLDYKTANYNATITILIHNLVSWIFSANALSCLPKSQSAKQSCRTLALQRHTAFLLHYTVKCEIRSHSFSMGDEQIALQGIVGIQVTQTS